METMKLWARNGEAVHQALELGELVHLDTASEELTDEFLLFAIQSGLLSKWAEAFPDPRREPEINVDMAAAEARAQRVAAKLLAWYNDNVGPSLLAYARVGKGRRIHIVDTTHVEVPLETGTYEGSGVVKNDDGSRSRGRTLATLRTLLDHAGLITQVGLCPMQGHDLPLCRLFFETASVLRPGDLLREDRGFVDGATLTFLKHQRHVDGIVPLKSTMVSYHEAVQLANLQDTWQPHPSREKQHIAFVQGVDHLWSECKVPLNACVIR